MAIPAMALLQQHDARRDILIEPAALRGGVQRSKLGGIRNWGCNRAVKTNRLIYNTRGDVVLALKSRCKGSHAASIRSAVVDEERMRTGHWLWSVL